MNTLASRAQLRSSFLRWALVCVPAVLLIGYLGSLFGQSGPENAWFAALERPGFYPPGWAFGVVWPILFVMIGLAFAWLASAWGARGRIAAIVALAVQFVLAQSWTGVFFGAQSIEGGMIVIALSVVLLLVAIALVWRVRRGAALLLLPYCAWLCFAAALNWQFVALNPDGGPETGSGAVERIEF